MRPVDRLLLVYNADWSLLGGLRYAAERLRTGQDPCALCEITYDGLSEKESWKTCRLHFGVPTEGVYKNQLESPAKEAAAGEYPCVLAEAGGETLKVLERPALETCLAAEDSVTALAEALEAGLAAKGLAIPKA